MKEIDVEKLLRWAYRDELPKREFGSAPAASWDAISSLGQMVDTGFIGEPGFPAVLGPPHPDALKVDNAVRSLDQWRLGLDNQAIGELMGTSAGIVSDRHGILKHLMLSPTAMLQLHARLGNRPIWDLGPFTCHRVIGANGKVKVQHIKDGRLVDGRTSSRHYGDEARCPLRWEPDPIAVVEARAEYAAWHAGLIRVTEVLCAWGLEDYRPKLPMAPMRPWRSETVHKPRIIEDLSRPSTVPKRARR